ncbi:MAG: RagB/SusD family nutrient uptake outer membrane protein [Muribaculaceae bacterium]|nr:RagB/SusD family nutrient uptake outer membrane protein [Muribaculaceae bacterium]MBR6432309.1 RagB/SusD family nutrient uptake outer membrane protein [Muribaculaceae bacterium]
MNKFKYFLIAGVAALGLSSCSSDFLDTAPTAETGTATVFESTDNVKIAVNGCSRVMMNQYLGTQGVCGEGCIMMWFGNYPGADFYVNLPGWALLINQNNHDTPTSQYTYYPWYYYYKLISNANSIILHVDEANGPDAEKQFYKAQALVYRAHAFAMLAQLYCKRWVDSDNGNSPGLVLRLDESVGDCPLTSLKDAYAQVYADLDEAISLFNASGMDRGADEFFLPSLEVAHAVYARAALARCDYATAATHAKAARQGHALMGNDALLSNGFCTHNSEWIWGGYSATDQTLYYYSYHAYIAYNSNAGNVRNYPKCVSKELFQQIPATDVRKQWWLDPTYVDEEGNVQTYPYTASTGLASNSTQLAKNTRAAKPDLLSNASVYAYMQWKVRCNDTPGVGELCIYRSSEMYLIEAEAEQKQGHDAAAQAALVALNKTSGRDPQYACTKTGADLFNEIKLYRRIELWGEGFDWFDLKRWKDPLVRHNPNEGGNFLATLAVTIQPNERNEWRFVIPSRETDYNKAVKDGVITPVGGGLE